MTHILERLQWRSFFALLAGCLAGLIVFQYAPVGAQEQDIEEGELELVFFATPRVIQKGESALIEWDAQGADYCTASDGWSGTKPAVGSQYVKPKKLKKYTYTLECYTNEGDQTGEISRTVEVVKKKSQKAPLPDVNFRVNRTSVTQGGTVTLSWKAKNAVGCRAMGPDGWEGLKMASGKEIISPDNSGTYMLRCWNTNLKYTDDHSVSVSVVEVPQDNKSGYLYTPPQPGPTPWGGPGSMQQGQFNQGPPPPSFPPGYFEPPTNIVIYQPPVQVTQPVRITFKPSTYKFYDAGEPIVLSWNARYATACIASGGWSGDRPISGSEHVRPDDTTEYKLTCYNSETSLDSVASVEIRKVKKKVTGTVGLTFSPARSIIYNGKEVTLTWDATNATSCVASGSWSGEKALAGSLTINPTKPETYYLDCKNDTHSKRKTSVIDIFKDQESKSGYIQSPQQIQPAPQPEQKPDYKPSYQSPAPTPAQQSVLRVAMNMAIPRSTFKPGAVDVVLGSMVVTNGSSEAVYFEDLTVTDNDGTDGLGKSFTNIKLITTGGVQMGGTLTNIGKDPGSKIAFIGHGSLVPAFGTVTLTLRGDVLSTASLQDDLKSDALKVVSAIENNDKGGKIAVAQLPVSLQRFALDVAVPEVSVSLDATSPLATSVEAGSLQVELGKFKIATTEAVNIRSLDVQLSPYTPFTTYLLKNLTVYQGSTVLGTMSGFVAAKTVLPTRIVLDKGNMTVLSVKADIDAMVTQATKFQVGVAGLQFEPDSTSGAASNAKVTATLPVLGNEMTANPKPASSSASTSTQATGTQSTSTQSQS